MDVLLSNYGDGDDEQEEEEENFGSSSEVSTTPSTKRKHDDDDDDDRPPTKRQHTSSSLILSDVSYLKDDDDDGDDELPPLPEIFTTNSSKDDEGREDDPSRHQGRIRSFKHVRGNYATYVYIPVKKTQEGMKIINRMIDKGISECPGLLASDDEYHISLTRTFPLKEYQIDPFISRVSDYFKNISQFDITLGDYEYFTNDENTRTFLSMRATLSSKFQANMCTDIRDG
eukprot:TRINITY_DN2965_c1_g1_i1.p1 TRINITY_DN2965_c1_g1~~TRINITY_DN2965_c1_g1_i1.p1  ORF type:complete len:229 (+),score=75.05 TRINITY_DN2965_c1_g1_i1:70-756(+)